MEGIVFSPDADRPGENDSREFCARAERIAALHGGRHVTFDNEAPYKTRAIAVLAALEAIEAGSLSWIAFCDHGWSTGIQPGFDVRGRASGQPTLTEVELGDAVARVARRGVPFTVYLAACSTAADTKHGFAEQLYSRLEALGVEAHLFAHTVVGHATANPCVRVWSPATWGGWILPITHGARGAPPTLWERWVLEMHRCIDPTIPALARPTLDLRYPWLTHEQLIVELGG